MDHLDSESYWNRSSSVAFSFDDDEDGAIGGFIGGEISATPLDVGNAIFNDDTLSEASFASTVGVLNLSIKSIINDEALRILLQEQSLDDRVMPKGVSPDEELKLLRRQIQTTLYSPSPEATAHKLLLGKNTPLEVFKSLNEKKQLLDTVLANGGGDSVIAVLLFLKKSLNRENFHKILKERSKALDHYISYLRQSDDLDQLIELLQRFGKHQEAALLQFQAALGQQDPVKRKQQLLRLNERYAGQSTLVNLYQQLFHGAYKLHELIEKEQNTLGSGVSYHSPPVDILYACCQKNTNWKEQDMLRLISPQRLTAEQQISASQYEWTTLNERARAQAYGDLESIFERMPTWNPMKTKQFHISFALELAVQRLHELQAPATVLYLFLSKMSNNTEKLALAQRVKCIKAMIDAMAGLKQVSELTQLKDSLPERSEEQFYCENALKGLQSKRWTTDNIKLKL